MNPLHQLTRRPVKAAFGVLLLALAGAILCLSGGQYWAAAQTRAAVEENYTTVAVVTGGMQQLVTSGNIVMVDIGNTYEANAFLQEPAQQNWSPPSKTGASSAARPQWALSADTVRS